MLRLRMNMAESEKSTSKTASRTYYCGTIQSTGIPGILTSYPETTENSVIGSTLIFGTRTRQTKMLASATCTPQIFKKP